MSHTQRVITSAKTCPISKLGGWKHTAAFHRTAKTNIHMLKHLGQYWCYGNFSVFTSEEYGGGWPIRNCDHISQSPANKEATQTKKPVAEVLAYLHVQISPISCNVVGSILHVPGKSTDTTIVGYRWTGVGGHHGLYC